MNLPCPTLPVPVEIRGGTPSGEPPPRISLLSVAPSWRVHVDCLRPLENCEYFFDGWLVDPEGLIAKAFFRIGRCVSEELLASAVRYPRPDVVAAVPAASSSAASPGLAARILFHERVWGHPSLELRPPSEQPELVLVMRDGSVHVRDAPLTPPATLAEREGSTLRWATGCKLRLLEWHLPERRERRSPFQVALHALLAVWYALRRLILGMGHDADRGDLAPAQELVKLHPVLDEWLAVGPDPAFRCQQTFAPGFYMLEVEMDLSRPRAWLRAYWDTGNGESESRAVTLRVRHQRLAKRLLRITQHARLRFDPTDFPCRIRLRHFRLAGVTRSFALNRMRQKLMRSGLIQRSEALDPEELWRRYDALFSPQNHAGIVYEDWIREVEAPLRPNLDTQPRLIETWAWRPKISIITSTHDTPLQFLHACANSVLGQTYPHWEWCIADDASTDPAVRACLEELAATDSRIRVTFRKRNGHISRASNSALRLASGEFVALLDHDDTLAQDALFHVVHALQAAPGAGIVYSDEDKLDERGQRCDPYFKPDWSPELLLGQNYVCHLAVYRRSLVTLAGGFRPGFEGSQDYDLLLRCSRLVSAPAAIVHVPRVLYHWRKSPASVAGDATCKAYATDAAVRALSEHVTTRAEKSDRISVVAPGLYRHHWPVPEPLPLVSIIIATRDAFHLLRRCVTTLVERTRYRAYELIIVDNQSTCPDTLAYLAALEAEPKLRVKVLRYDAPFNFAAINNAAARAARGQILVLLNNDIEVISEGWLAEMVSYCVRPRIGCVGGKLCYPDDTIQHAGVVLGIGGVAGHPHKHFDRNADGYFGRLRIAHEVSAVTGAALAVRKEIYARVGGLDEENLAIAFNDVDFCLRVGAEGFTNIFTPFAELYHHESRSRGVEDTPAKQARFAREYATMRERWGALLDRDPYYSPNLSNTHEDYGLASVPVASVPVASVPVPNSCPVPGAAQSGIPSSQQPPSLPSHGPGNAPAAAGLKGREPGRGSASPRPRSREVARSGAFPKLWPPLLFVHIPKTGGTSLRVAGDRVFRERMLRDYGASGRATSPEIRRFVYDEPDLDALRRLLSEGRVGMLCGHISYAKYAELFTPEQVLVMLRDPVERLVSLYHHEVRVHHHTGTLLEFASRPAERNTQSRLVHGLDLSRACLVGTVERYTESLRLLALKTGLELKPLRINANPERLTVQYNLTPEERSAILGWNERDMALYREADRLLTEGLGRYSLDLSAQ